MLEHLKEEEILNEGYHLGDMLSKTSYISGDKRTFDEYHQKSHAVVTSNDKKSEFSELFEQIDEDLQNFDILDQQLSASMNLQSYNIKRVIYRSASIFVVAIGRISSIKESSSFDIIDKLVEDKRCSEIVAHKLRFMVAMACELRFKVYQSKGRQDDIFMEGSGYKKVVSGLVELIGGRSLSTFMVTTYMLHRMLKGKLTLGAPLDLDVLDDAVWGFKAKLRMLHQLGFKNDLMLEIAKLGSTIQPSHVGIDDCINVVIILYGIKEYQLGLDLCTKILPPCKDDLQVFLTKLYKLLCIVRLDRYDAREVEGQLVELDELMVYVEAAPPGDVRRWDVAQQYADCLRLCI